MNYQEIPYEKINTDTVRFKFGGNTFTLNLDDTMIISADNDGSITFDPKYVMEVDEKNQILRIEK